MLWIYGLVAFLVAVITYSVFRYFSLRILISGVLTAILVVVAIALTHVLLMPYNFVCGTYEAGIISQSPFFNLVKDKSPSEYNAYIAKIKENIKAKGDLSNEIYYETDFINALLIKYGPMASNQSLYKYLKSSVSYDKALVQVDPVLVLYHEFPEKFANQKIDFKNINVNEYKNAILDAAEDAVTSGMTQPQPLPTADETKKAMMMFRDVVQDLSKKYGSKTVITILQQPNNPALDRKQAAEIVIAFFDAIVAKGQNDAALFLKATLVTNRPK
jgi:hypothetical protein